MAKTPLPPWRRAEREDADQNRRVEITNTATIASYQGSESWIIIDPLEGTTKNKMPTPEHYIYNRKNLTPGTTKQDANASLPAVKSLSDTVYNTCQNSPCLKYEGKEDEGPRMTGVFSLDTKFDSPKTMIVSSFYLRTPECLKGTTITMPRIRFTVLRNTVSNTDI